jgi:hypothetical protein
LCLAAGLLCPKAAAAEDELDDNGAARSDENGGGDGDERVDEEKPEGPFTFDYDDDGPFVAARDDSFRAAAVLVLQPRTALALEEGSGPYAAVGFRRLRLGVEGHLFIQELGYGFVTGWEDGVTGVVDAYLDYTLAAGVLQVRVGQFKRPYTRHFLATGTDMHTFDRSIAVRRSFAARDLGVMLHNDHERSPALEYAFGLFNGTEQDPALRGERLTSIPENVRPLLVGRLGANLYRSRRPYPPRGGCRQRG